MAYRYNSEALCISKCYSTAFTPGTNPVVAFIYLPYTPIPTATVYYDNCYCLTSVATTTDFVSTLGNGLRTIASETLVGSCADFPHLTGCTDVQFNTPNCVFASGANSGAVCYDTCFDVNAKTCTVTGVSTSCILPSYALNSANLCIPSAMSRYVNKIWLNLGVSQLTF